MKPTKKVAKKSTLTSIEAKRVEILKDALAQVRAEAFVPMSCNGYVRGKIHNEIEALADKNRGKEVELKKYLSKLVTPKKPCDVCARGALLLSSIRKFNNFTLEEARDENLDNLACERTAAIFGHTNANLMEQYFENNVSPSDDHNYDYWEDLTDEERVIRIFENAIKYKGIFKPNKEKFD